MIKSEVPKAPFLPVFHWCLLSTRRMTSIFHCSTNLIRLRHKHQCVCVCFVGNYQLCSPNSEGLMYWICRHLRNNFLFFSNTKLTQSQQKLHWQNLQDFLKNRWCGHECRQCRDDVIVKLGDTGPAGVVPRYARICIPCRCTASVIVDLFHNTHILSQKG